MTRTVRDYLVPGLDVLVIRGRVLEWFRANNFRILDKSADGKARTYDAPEIARGAPFPVTGGHLRFPSPLGSIVALNVVAAGSLTPTAFAVSVGPGIGGTLIHGEFFTPTSVESMLGPFELELINTIWAPAGIQRKKAYVLLEAFEGFVRSLSSPLPSA